MHDIHFPDITEEKLDIKSIALLLIDLQKGIMHMETKPYSAGAVIRNASTFAGKFRDLGMPVFPVHVMSNQWPPRVR